MPIADDELRAIQFLADRVRRATPGATPWDAVGLAANLRKLAGRNLHMTIEHVIRHAADPAAKTPGVLASGFTPAAPTDGGRFHPPSAADACRTCGGWCPRGNCLRDQLGPDDDPNPRADHTTDPRALAHAEMARAKARLCGCGVRAEVCPVHRMPEGTP